MDTVYTFGDNITHYKTKSVHFLGLMNSATRLVYDHVKDGMYHCSREALGLPSGNIGFGILRNMLP